MSAATIARAPSGSPDSPPLARPPAAAACAIDAPHNHLPPDDHAHCVQDFHRCDGGGYPLLGLPRDSRDDVARALAGDRGVR